VGSAERLESGLGLGLDPRYQVIGDGSRLGQVLRNVLSNACKFTPRGGTVAVTLLRVPGGMPEQLRIALPEEQSGLLTYPRAGSVRISVLDSGAGLSEQQVLDVGKEGLQFNASELQGGGGSGLGLFMCKGLVQQHGGQITVTSPGLGKGVTITLEFPLFDTFETQTEHIDGIGAKHAPHADADSQEQQEHQQVGARGGSGASAYRLSAAGLGIPDGGAETGLGLGTVGTVWRGGAAAVPWPLNIPPSGMHILAAKHSVTPTAGSRHMLVVDDAITNRKMLTRIFHQKGFICVEAFDGQDALHKFAQMCAQETPPE
jgi:hypothetical protein